MLSSRRNNSASSQDGAPVLGAIHVGCGGPVELLEELYEAVGLVLVREVPCVRKHLELASRHGAVRFVPVGHGNDRVSRTPDE